MKTEQIMQRSTSSNTAARKSTDLAKFPKWVYLYGRDGSGEQILARGAREAERRFPRGDAGRLRATSETARSSRARATARGFPRPHRARGGVAIRAASERWGTGGSTLRLYVTARALPMCAGAINEARIPADLARSTTSRAARGRLQDSEDPAYVLFCRRTAVCSRASAGRFLTFFDGARR